jgi:AraC-like DNA-binding protein
MFDITYNPWEWKIVSSLFTPDLTHVVNQEHMEWYKKHIDRHPHREVLIGLEGESLYCLDNKIYKCSPGTVFLFDSFEEHDNYYSPHTSTAVHLWFNFMKKYTTTSLFIVNNGQIINNKSKNYVIHNYEWGMLFNRCWSEIKEKTSMEPALKRLKLVSLLVNLVFDVFEKDFKDPAAGNITEAHENIINPIKQHIYETSGKGLTLDNLSRIAGYSKYHFLRIFKKLTNQSVHEYINECRLQKAAELRKKGYRKKQIADELGFSCLAAYSRWYKQMGKER